MFRILFILILFVIHESVKIEYPPNQHIEERLRKDIDSIDSIFRYYIVPNELQFHAKAIQDDLPYFLRCKGTTKAIQFTVPTSATKYLSLDTDFNTNIITATLRRNELTSNLVGRYTCSEIINEKKYEATVHVFIQDGKSVFTETVYPTVFKQTGIHFFNLPCQTTSWYPRISCPIPSNSKQCQLRQCNSKERQANELSCNTPVCDGQEICIPVYYTPIDLKPEKVFFDPQIGFALENPTIPSVLPYFTCMSNYTPSQQSKVPYNTYDPEYVQIHQPSLTVMSDETVRLSCEIQYGTKVDRKIPILFWFEDIYNLNLISNQTEKPVFNLQTQINSRNSSITLRGFKPNKVYRFYCVRISDQGLYSRSVDITCTDTPSLDLEINLNGADTNDKISYGSNSTYDISIFTIPRSSIVLDLSRNGISLINDKRFELLLSTNQENQFFEYSLTIYNMTFEDETDLKITAKSSASEKTVVIKPNIIGNPVGQLSFVPEQIPHTIPWRNENSNNKVNIYPYGVFERESYRIACTIRHRSDINRPLNIFIKYSQCSIDNCLSNLIDQTCQMTSNQNILSITSNRINDYQTQFISSTSQTIDNPTIGYQYLCCYEQNGLINIAKAITILSQNRNMFNIHKPEFSLVTGDILTYRCESHDLIYDDLRMIYNDKFFTYERNRFDPGWRIVGTNQIKQVDVNWNLPLNEQIQSTAIEVKTGPLRMIGNNGYFQCIAISKRPDVIPNANDTYKINVDDPELLEFKNNLQLISRLDRKAGDNVELDCQFNGRPKPKLVWLKGKLPLKNDDSTLQFGDNNGSISITRAQPSDTGYYTCELNNGRDAPLQRSFDLRVKGSNPYSKMSRFTAMIVIISALLLLIMIILLLIFIIKYIRMRRNVQGSMFHGLIQTPLPENFATTEQIRTFLSYINHETLPMAKDDFKELGHGQFGIVYQVRLPEVGLVAAKTLPETIRNNERRRDDRKKSTDIDEENVEILSKHDIQKKKAAEMLIDEIKVMHKAGKHVNIVALKKVAYPEAKFKFMFLGGPIRDEDSFYLMELCSNGSLESMLKYFNQPIQNSATHGKLSLYETLSKQTEPNMTVKQAHEECLLTDDDLKLIAYQVACGVDYLNRRQIAHCDIASRNVLVTSRFIMKICDFGLATWTTYKNYREQLAQHESVQLEKKNNEIATHNLTPELAKTFLRASSPDDRQLLNKLSIKSDVWSFGIFLWTLFLKCRIRPFSKLLDEMEKTPDGGSFFHRLALVISEGHVRQYINYHQEIPQDIDAIISICLVEENNRPEMTRIRALLCHSKMLSKQAFQYYRSEYNRYQEENISDENIESFGEVQGVSDLPSFDSENAINDNDSSGNTRRYENVNFRPTTTVDPGYYQDSYLEPDNNTSRTTTDGPNVYLNDPTPSRPPPPPPLSYKKPNGQDDSYL
ncbi:unnamed protein product [Adineta steineri]|uniref:Uncharacterized protein n=1 Tax=Adineta steineri TaxID=433720 RepID=A0A818Q0B8_9BILA|nr:unnamed protein product [Adineta steineri]CAF3631715.1 unnamed protein product [Adineta steineri]